MKDFNVYLQRAIRRDDSIPPIDWSPHYVDYQVLKDTLQAFAKRRLGLRKILKRGGYVSEEDVILIDRALKAENPLLQKTVLSLADGSAEAGAAAAAATAAAAAAGGIAGGETDGGQYFKYNDNEEPQPKMISAKEVKSRIPFMERSQFCSLLDDEVAKAASFYGAQLVHLAKKISDLDTVLSHDSSSSPHDRSSGGVATTTPTVVTRDKNEDTGAADAPSSSSSPPAPTPDFESVGTEILELYAFAVVNLITLRQILFRYDGFVRTFHGMALSQWYMENTSCNRQHYEGGSSESTSSGCQLQDLFHLHALKGLEISFVLRVQETQIRCMRDERSNDNDDGGNSITSACSSTVHESVSYLKEFSSQRETFQKLLDKTFHSVEKAAGGHIGLKDRCVGVTRDLFLLGSITRNLELEPRFLHVKGKNLKKELKTVVLWRERKQKFGSSMEGGEADETSRKDQIDPENVLPLILNLLSCFLYMMNSYIVEPSSAYYVSALGGNEALSGILIGAMPWAAVCSAVLYSYWTNYCYKQPIIFAALLMCGGNFLYASGYGYNSIGMVMFGRFLTGLGAPRIINRRYVADATPFSLRTAASAAFAMATALGAAMGPGAAILLDFFDFEFQLPIVGTVYFNGMTGPGWFMLVTWGIYTLCIILTFKEPTRSGLEELKRREAAKKQQQQQSKSTVIEPGKNSKLLSTNSFDSAATITSGFDEISDDSSIDCDTLISNKSQVSAEREYCCSCLSHITRAVIICMTLIYLKRITLETVVGSTSVITKNRYGWGVKNVGLLHFINGCLVIPISILSGYLSQYYADRYMTVWLLGIALAGTMLLIDVTDFVTTETETYNEDMAWSVGPVQYIAGSLIAFSSIEACESFVASLMSKVVPSALATGTFNSGLLATLVGTSGRATGDVLITLCGYISIRNLLNLLVVPSCILMVLNIILVYVSYDELSV